MPIIARTDFEKKVVCMDLERLIQYFEEATGHTLLKTDDLEYLILLIETTDMIFSNWPIDCIDFIKQVLIARLREELRKRREKERMKSKKRPWETDILDFNDFTEAVESMGRPSLMCM